jgi:hypothetical protein
VIVIDIHWFLTNLIIFCHLDKVRSIFGLMKRIAMDENKKLKNYLEISIGLIYLPPRNRYKK